MSRSRPLSPGGLLVFTAADDGRAAYTISLWPGQNRSRIVCRASRSENWTEVAGSKGENTASCLTFPAEITYYTHVKKPYLVGRIAVTIHDTLRNR
jgi:hypothetical protein